MNQDDMLTAYHRWYYDGLVWNDTRFLGVKCLKSVCDLWNYQEIIVERRPRLIIETGIFNGGSTLFFSTLLALIDPQARIVAIDIDTSRLDPRVSARDNVTVIAGSSADPAIARRLIATRDALGGGIFAVLDSDHSKEHVLAELENFRPLLRAGDYLIVEDGNINGHPVLPGFGPGPYEAIEDYERKYPGDYAHDSAREGKFGFTFAPKGFLIRR